MPRIKTIKSGPDRGCICFVPAKPRNVSLDTSRLKGRAELDFATEWLGFKSALVRTEDQLSSAIIAHAKALEEFSLSTYFRDPQALVATALHIARLHSEASGQRAALKAFERSTSDRRLSRVMLATTVSRGWSP